MRATLLFCAVVMAALPAVSLAQWDDRERFQASGWLGIGIDNFAAQELQTYYNPTANSKIRQRGAGGINFQFRLTPEPGMSKRKQLWIYGETVHGVRSEDVNCTDRPNFPTCVQDPASFRPTGKEFLYMLRNASSLEAFTGLRYEFLPLINDGAEHQASLYLKAQAGFLTVSGSEGDFKDLHHLALGLIATKGAFVNSYLEGGWGRSDLFHLNRRRRAKFDGYLEFPFPGGKVLSERVRFFAQFTADTDLSNGSDSAQTYLGVTFDLGKLFTAGQ